MRMLNAQTLEIDDPALAVSEILDQLELEKNLLKNSIGIISCYSEFLESGVVAALCEALPFDVAGCTTLGNAVPGQTGMMMLCLSVLTADDVSFAAHYSGPLAEGDLETIDHAFNHARASLPEDPAMILSFLPLTLDFGGESIVNRINTLAGGIPVFGTVASDHLPGYRSTALIHNGTILTDSVIIVLMAGRLHSRFLVHSIPDKKVQKQRALITSSKDNLLREVNNMPVLNYMKTLGLSSGNGIEGMTAIPFLVDSGDGGPPVAKAMYTVTPEGHILCTATMPQGAFLSIGSIDAADVLETSGSIAEKVNGIPDKNGAFIFSCLSRNVVLGTQVLSELEKLKETLAPGLPYHIAYSGGEVCPVYTETGKMANRFHNFSIIAWVF